MAGRRRAPSKQTAPDGLTAARNGLGPERVPEIQRSRILGAMVEVTAEHGSANVAVAHVVERAGVSRRTFYELFSDREECFLAAADDGIARARRYVFDAYDPDASWSDRVRTALIGLLWFLEAERGAGCLLIVGSLGAGASALEYRRRVVAQIIELIDQGRTETKAGSEVPPLTAEGIVGGVLSVLHARLLEDTPGSFVELTGPLMSMIVLPYLGAPAAHRELKRTVPESARRVKRAPADPLRDVEMRLTYRTVRVLTAIAAHPNSSNREIGLVSGVQDQGQMSKLLTRLQKLGVIENSDVGQARGAPNAWMLTAKGQEIEQAIGQGMADAGLDR